MAITEAVKEDIWLKGLFGELDDRLKVTTVFCDNQSAIFLSKDQMFHDRIKHIDIRYHFVRDIIEKGDCVVEKIHTDYNPADMFTKSLPIAKFKLCLDLSMDQIGRINLIGRKKEKEKGKENENENERENEKEKEKENEKEKEQENENKEGQESKCSSEKMFVLLYGKNVTRETKPFLTQTRESVISFMDAMPANYFVDVNPSEFFDFEIFTDWKETSGFCQTINDYPNTIISLGCTGKFGYEIHDDFFPFPHGDFWLDQ
ncbi:hypothetical protein LXL04_006228 [Taraxacum kok-saghyz]